MTHTWNIHGPYTEHTWNVHGTELEGKWNTNGIYMKRQSRVNVFHEQVECDLYKCNHICSCDKLSKLGDQYTIIFHLALWPEEQRVHMLFEKSFGHVDGHSWRMPENQWTRAWLGPPWVHTGWYSTRTELKAVRCLWTPSRRPVGSF